MELAGSNVLGYQLADGTTLVVRPSGTEPKIKVYVLASGTDSDNANYQIVLFQRGDASTYEDYIGQSESDLKSAYGVISPRKVKIQIEGATVTAVRCDIQAYYAVLATVEYDSGDVVYVSGLTKLASISDIVNLVESVSLT